MTDHPHSPDSSALSHAPAPAAIRHDGWTPKRQRAFCEALAECGNVERAAQATSMSRESAYRLRQRAAGRAFALAWDAALLLARQRLIDDAFDMAFDGAVERHYRDGKLILEKRKRDPRSLLATVERLGSSAALGSAPVKAVAQDFEAFLDCMEADGTHARGATANFMELAEDRASQPSKASISATRHQLSQQMRRALPRAER
jgi:hypothetical protein